MKRFSAILAPLWGLLSAASATATPSQIVIIRHAEKPASGDGVNQQGCERAYLLPDFFESSSIVNRFGTPVAIYAVQPGHAGGSVRSAETIAPTAQALGLKIKDPYTKTDYTDVVHEISNKPGYVGKTVLMAWEHDAIPGLAQAFGVVLNSQTSVWPDVVFDEAWVLDFSDGGAPTLQIIPEDVLPGDNTQGGFSNWQNGPTASSGEVPKPVVDECVNDTALDRIASLLANPPLATQ